MRFSALVAVLALSCATPAPEPRGPSPSPQASAFVASIADAAPAEAAEGPNDVDARVRRARVPEISSAAEWPAKTADGSPVDPEPESAELPGDAFAFEEIALPVTAKTPGSIVGVGSSSPSDVWLLRDDGTLYQVEGSDAKRRGQACPSSGIRRFGRAFLDVSPSSMVVVASAESRGVLVGRWDRARAWRCELIPPSALRWEPPSLGQRADAAVLFDDARYGARRVRTLDGSPLVPPPIAWKKLVTSSRVRGWAASTCDPPSPGEPCRAELWEYNGVSWLVRTTIDVEPGDLYQDELGRLFVLGSTSKKSYDSHHGHHVVARWDGARWERLGVPKELGADQIVGHGSRDVVFLQKGALFRFDGAGFRRATVPLEEVLGAHHTADGTLWLVGTQARAHVFGPSAIRSSGGPR